MEPQQPKRHQPRGLSFCRWCFGAAASCRHTPRKPRRVNQAKTLTNQFFLCKRGIFMR